MMLVELVPVSLTVTLNLFFIVEINHQITINYIPAHVLMYFRIMELLYTRFSDKSMENYENSIHWKTIANISL